LPINAKADLQSSVRQVTVGNSKILNSVPKWTHAWINFVHLTHKLNCCDGYLYILTEEMVRTLKTQRLSWTCLKDLNKRATVSHLR